MIVSEEKLKIINSNERVIKVNAGPGTGKTFLLSKIAEANKDKSVACLTFTRNSAEKNRSEFPSSSKVMSFHQLSYNVYGKSLKRKIKNEINYSEVREFLIDNRHKSTNKVVSDFVAAYNAFCYSAVTLPNYKVDKSLNKSVFDKFWELSIDPKSGVSCTHDTHLKLLSLSDFILPFDIIMVDESQDLNPSMRLFIQKQISDESKKVVIVGDHNQQIMRFRGSENCLEVIKEGKSYTIEETYRFGKNVCSLLNAILFYGKKSTYSLKTKSENNTKIANVEGKHVIITRTNLGSLFYALENEKEGKKVFIRGKLDKSIIKKVFEVEKLKQYGAANIVDPVIKAFGNYPKLKNWASISGDLELFFACQLVDKYKNIHSLVMNLMNSKVSISEADVLIMNTHEAKGLEFNNVVIADDFIKIIGSNGLPRVDLDEEEVNILFVAASRAKKVLQPNSDLKKLISFLRDKSNKDKRNKERRGNKSESKKDNPFYRSDIKKGLDLKFKGSIF